MLESYDRKAKPTWDNNKPVNVTFSMDLYQILELNEPQQYILLNAWVIERWHDEFLYWSPSEYNNITEIRLPHDSIWIPDTTLYENLVMKDDDSRRLLNAKLTTNITRKAALVELLYPTIYKFSCLLNLRYFPFDVQVCSMTFSSWTYDQKGIDYFQYSSSIGTSNFLENEAWYLVKTTIKRKEVKYSCCPNAYTLLKLTLYLRRKPLFYIINLIIPTSIITLIAIVGFFTTSSASGMREEKVSLGITTLLSMSILMLMVSDQMPTTSSFIPLIGWFILGTILLISLGTLASTIVIAVQKRGRLGERLSSHAVKLTRIFGVISFTEAPSHLIKGTKEYEECPPSLDRYKRILESRKLEDGESKRPWFSSPFRRKNGASMMPTEKSTEPLVHRGFSSDEVSQKDEIQNYNPAALPPPPPPAMLKLALHDDNSSIDSEMIDTSRPITARSKIMQSTMLQHANMFNANIRQNRQLAQKEYEWLATEEVPLVRLTRDILAPHKYDKRVRPVIDHTVSLKIHLTMSLYQIVEVNEPAQNIKMNVWMIQKWVDEALDWDPEEYGGINTTILPHNVLWLPDTVVYNSVVMNPDETERYMNIRVDSLRSEGKRGALMSFLYPAMYTITCRLNIRYFPYDQQNCTLTISSWTNSKSALDYYADEHVNLQSYISNEEWDVISFKIYRHEYKYACCPEPWVILEASIVLRRKALYYLVNLIIPTSVITIVAVTGFFTPASTSDDRTEKINLGITTLLAMSILMLMVSDQMPTTSEFVPLIAWFYLMIIIVISIGTFLTSVVLSIQGRRQYGRMPPLCVRLWFFTRINKWVWLEIPPQLEMLWEELDDHPSTKLTKNQNNNNNNQILDLNGADTEKMEIIEKPEIPPLEKIPSNTSLLKPARARSNWLKVGAAAAQKKPLDSKIPLNLMDIAVTPESPTASILASRRSSASAWDNAMALVTSPTTSNKDTGKTPRLREVDTMKQRRQCSLEWELLATILDRILLFVFVFSVIIVTVGMMGTGYVAQLHYDQLAREQAKNG
ncbi:hypothetical protein FO519_005704 [Halicephalobus sp. NKZ332]|nr:hypothetical protein FO519_005704 [Halicephalobus sp. NKZ332]